jgi:hypothetical protein
MSRRRGSATALNASVVVAARAMAHHMPISACIVKEVIAPLLVGCMRGLHPLDHLLPEGEGRGAPSRCPDRAVPEPRPAGPASDGGWPARLGRYWWLARWPRRDRYRSMLRPIDVLLEIWPLRHAQRVTAQTTLTVLGEPNRPPIRNVLRHGQRQAGAGRAAAGAATHPIEASAGAESGGGGRVPEWRGSGATTASGPGQ